MKLSTIDVFKHIRSDDAIELSKEQLHSLQTVLNAILKDIVSVCNQYGINYCLGGGTALGAVRHHGFIPWDDDIDINMPRADYERFIPLFRKEFGDRYWIHTPGSTHNYGLALSRILKKGTSVRTREDFWNKECGAFIDIFIIENTFDNRVLRLIHAAGCYFYGFALSCRKFWRDRKPLMKLLEGIEDENEKKALRGTFRVKIALGFLLSFCSMDAWVHGADRWYGMCHDDHSRMVVIPAGRGHFRGELYRRDQICETTDCIYDGVPMKVARDYDAYLTRLYGDYMKVPDPEKRERHVFFAPFRL